MRAKTIVVVVLVVLGWCVAAVADSRPMVWLRGWDGLGRAFDLQSVRGQVVALTFCSRWTKDEAERVNAALAGRARPGDVLIVSIVDFNGVPSLFKGYARRKIAEHDKSGMLLHLVDEQGGLKRAFQTEPEKRVDILIIDRDGSLKGRFTGEKQLEDAIRLLERLRGVSNAAL